MDEYMRRHMRLAAELEQLCAALFERWCERRSVIPLTFLMRNWPIVSPSTPNFHSLSLSLEQLAICEDDALDLDDRKLILQIVWIANHIV
ncbi:MULTISPECIES: hypothetical protein [unclassified Paraburkholderia]|uniref:hypothetical protein n=1 Tax=unclassified Paraburkholderia TaxID=2615204 RepID=UPI002AB2A826|nr:MULTISPECIES: hypothetical protein [unclassified Paraburkholderia]